VEAAQDSCTPLASLIRVAVHSDDSARLIAAAGVLAALPLALVGPHGETLGYAPDGSDGRRALAVARAAARNRLATAVGWRIVPIRRTTPLGFLAIGTRPGESADEQALVDALPELVAEQLHRVALLRAHRDAFVRRLVSDPRFDVEEARHEAGELGLQLADAYVPAIVTWQAAPPPLPVVERLVRDARRQVERSLAVLLPHRIVVLYPAPATGAPLAEASAWLAQIVAQARALAPSFPLHAIVADAAVELAGVGAELAELDALRRLAPRAGSSGAVIPSGAYALERLWWDHLDLAAARRFVDARLEPLTNWDRAHRTDLVAVLEAALDFPRHDQAASSCFMHRNTFRHRLRQASELLGTTLDDPDERLGLHVALKLRRLLAAASLDGDAGVAGAQAAAASRSRGQPTRRSIGAVRAHALRPLRRHV